MPVPATTGRTFWFNASDNDKLWDTIPAGSGSNPANGGNMKSWDDEDGGNEELQEETNHPSWLSNGINSLGALEFEGTERLLGTGSGSTLSNVISASAYTVFVSFFMDGAASNTGDMGGNSPLITETGTFFGVHCSTVTGVHTVHASNWDSDRDSVGKVFDLNTKYVVMTRHEGGNLFVSLNQGSESSVASGNTGSLTGVMSTGAVVGQGGFIGRIGEILVYNVALSGTDLTDTYQYMMDKWVTAGATPLSIQIPPPSVAGITAQLV